MTDLELERELIKIRRLRQEIEFEPRKYRVAFAVMIAAIVVASAAAGGFLTAVLLSKPPQPIVIHLEK